MKYVSDHEVQSVGPAEWSTLNILWVISINDWQPQCVPEHTVDTSHQHLCPQNTTQKHLKSEPESQHYQSISPESKTQQIQSRTADPTRLWTEDGPSHRHRQKQKKETTGSPTNTETVSGCYCPGCVSRTHNNQTTHTHTHTHTTWAVTHPAALTLYLHHR